MKIITPILVLICVTLCSCELSPKIKLGEAGDGATLISIEETRQIGDQFLTNRYRQAQLVSEQGIGQTWTYRFATNGTVLPLSVVVDRKTGKARFENLDH